MCGRARRKCFLLGLIVLVTAAGYPVGRHLWARHHLTAARESLDRRDFVQAHDHLMKCLAVWPDDQDTLLLAAQAARLGENHDAALGHLQKYVDRHSRDAALDHEYRLLHTQQGHVALIHETLARCLARPNAPETPAALEAGLRGALRALANQDREPVALLPELDAPIQGGLLALLVPPSLEAQFDTREAGPLLAKVFPAVELWLRLRPGQPDQLAGLVWRGRAHAYANDAAKARADFTRVLELDPGHFDARYYLATLQMIEAPRKAAAHLEYLRRCHPDSNRVRFTLAVVYRNLGRPDEARQLLDEMLAANPNNVAALIESGQLALSLQQPTEADSYLQRALALAPEEPAVLFALASCARFVGRPDDAKRYQERYQQLLDRRQRAQQLP